MSASSTSLASSVFNYTYENGRRYHAYRAGAYFLPNDELEQDRLDLRHHIFRLTLDGELFRAPLFTVPDRVLDIGTGTGIWAMDFADEFPSVIVIGTDLSPIQPRWVPPNCKFVVDDAESDWLYTPDETFDFIHGRALGGSIADWTRFYQQVYTHLKPGGWIEMQEYEVWVKSDDDSINRGGKLSEWQRLVDEASTKFGKRFNVAEMHKQYLIDAGFVDVQDDIYKVCLGSVDKLMDPENYKC
jgi:trans-aconitate methyltransferase